MRTARSCAGLWLAALLLGCGSAEPRAGIDAGAGMSDAQDLTDSGPGDAAEAVGDAAEAVDAAANEPCATNEVTLVPRAFGDTERYYVRVLIRGSTVALELDTGSNVTFLAQGPGAPVYTPHADDFEIGCERLPIAGRGLDIAGAAEIDGTPVVGLLGMDYLLAKPSLLDPAARTLTRSRIAPDVRARVIATLPFDTVQGLALVPLHLDGVALRLMFDTGGETLWVGQMGGPGDRRQDVVDAQGTVFPVWIGTATLSAAGLQRVVRVARAPAFPYFEDTVRALGGNVHGLLGLEAFQGDALLISPGRLELLRP